MRRPRVIGRLLPVLLLAWSVIPAARAETEGFTYQCESGLCFWRRPVVEPPPGWVRDEAAGHQYRFNAFARKGEDFAKAAAILYANAIYRKNAEPSLAGQIAADRERILKDDPRAKISESKPVRNADAKTLRTFAFAPGGTGGTWETVAYDEEGEYYIRFVLSALTQAAHDKALADFTAFVRGYTRARKK